MVNYTVIGGLEPELTYPDPDDAFEFEPAEVATMVVINVVLLSNFGILAYCFHRARVFRPLKARQLHLTLLGCLGTHISEDFCFCIHAHRHTLAGSLAFVNGAGLAYRVYPVYPDMPVGICSFVMSARCVVESGRPNSMLLSACFQSGALSSWASLVPSRPFSHGHGR